MHSKEINYFLFFGTRNVIHSPFAISSFQGGQPIIKCKKDSTNTRKKKVFYLESHITSFAWKREIVSNECLGLLI